MLATKTECDGAAPSVVAVFYGLTPGPGVKLPTPEAISALCVQDRWEAAFVRCVVETRTMGKCPFKPIVEDGIRGLAGIPPA